MNLAIEKSAGRQNYCLCLKAYAHLRDGTDDAVTCQNQVVHRLLEQPQAGLIFQPPPHRGPVQHAVGLSPRGSHRRPFARIQDAELNAGLVGSQGHGAAERIDLLDEVALADAADRRVATHLPQRLDVVGQQQGAATHARCGECGFRAGMAAADDDDIEVLRMEHRGCDRRVLTGGQLGLLPEF